VFVKSAKGYSARKILQNIFIRISEPTPTFSAHNKLQITIRPMDIFSFAMVIFNLNNGTHLDFTSS